MPGQITAAWFNAIIAKYKAVWPAINVANAVAGQPMRSAHITDLINQVSNAAYANDMDVVLPDLSAVAVGKRKQLLVFGDPVPKVGTTVRYSTAGTYTFSVPDGVHSVMVNWIVAAGGAGGAGSEGGNGGGGGGGGSGGFKQYALINCAPKDKLTIVIGAGGQPNPATASGSSFINGGDGGNTNISLNGNLVFVATGGKGGLGSNNNKGTLTAAGGLGGTYNGANTGLSGQTGPAGSNDRASCYGGGGAPGPVAGSRGGAGGKKGAAGDVFTGGSAGSAGVGFGSGGGGGGSADRSGGHFWAGGTGAPGFVEITYPSNGATGGTPAQVNTSYSTTAAVTANGATGGGFTGGTVDPNGTAAAN